VRFFAPKEEETLPDPVVAAEPAAVAAPAAKAKRRVVRKPAKTAAKRK